MIVLDASVLIAHLDRRDALHARATSLLLEVADEPFGASSITLAEVLVAPVRAGALPAAGAALAELAVAELPLPHDAATRLSALRAESGLKLSDCCVLLVAEDARAGIATFDERLTREARRRGLGT